MQKVRTLTVLGLVTGMSVCLPSPALSDDGDQEEYLSAKTEKLESEMLQLRAEIQEHGHRIRELDSALEDAQRAGFGALVSILFGAFCALWAQNTGRSAWGWFFLGLLFSVITVVVLLVKNSSDRKAKLQTRP